MSAGPRVDRIPPDRRTPARDPAAAPPVRPAAPGRGPIVPIPRVVITDDGFTANVIEGDW